jgi:DNA mismatch endonuclease (patch repair protein)
MPVGRSENMRRIRSKNTSPELAVRKLLRELGFTGYRLHRKELPGKPDIAFVGRKKAVMIHGCFWHGHDCKEGLRRPKTNEDYWIPKIARNQARDREHAERLAQMGWGLITVWECELRNVSALADRLQRFLAKERGTNEQR